MPTPVVGTNVRAVGFAYNQGGVYRVTGTTKNVALPTNVPVYRKVRLHNQASGKLLAEAWSDSVTGAYAFNYVPAGVYYVLAFDHTGTYNGVIATDVVAEPMP